MIFDFWDQTGDFSNQNSQKSDISPNRPPNSDREFSNYDSNGENYGPNVNSDQSDLICDFSAQKSHESQNIRGKKIDC